LFAGFALGYPIAVCGSLMGSYWALLAPVSVDFLDDNSTMSGFRTIADMLHFDHLPFSTDFPRECRKFFV
jgi:hypothetical protein